MVDSRPDFLVIGGGIIGLTTAFFLSQRGASVAVLDRREVGREASWAGAGMLPPGHRTDAVNPEERLRSYSHQVWRGLFAQLKTNTGIDSGYRQCGSLQIFPRLSSASEIWCQRLTEEQIEFRKCSPAEVTEFGVVADSSFREYIFLPEVAQVRNPWHLQALKAACLKQGVQIAEGCQQVCLDVSDDRVVAVRCGSFSYVTQAVCLAAGAWSGQLLQSISVSCPVKPVRGQILQLRSFGGTCRTIVEYGKQYLVPRSDGLILVGSTEEDAGFIRQNTADGVAELLRFADSVIPGAAQWDVERSWSGLRPCLPDELPVIGQVPEFENLYIGTGHFRSGLQMSPGTAAILADLMSGATPAISLEGLRPEKWLVRQRTELS